jgi:hypothetical protein
MQCAAALIDWIGALGWLEMMLHGVLPHCN